MTNGVHAFCGLCLYRTHACAIYPHSTNDGAGSDDSDAAAVLVVASRLYAALEALAPTQDWEPELARSARPRLGAITRATALCPSH